MEKKVLLLNASYEPLKIVSWQKAIVLYFSDKVNIIEEYKDFPLKSQYITIQCPSVIILKQYVKVNHRRVAFSKSNVFGRDYYTCQYCAEQPGTKSLTFDHVVPKSKGGETTWENIVTACRSCNSKKDNMLLSECGMVLLKEPRRPKSFKEIVRSLKSPDMPKCWNDYLPD